MFERIKRFNNLWKLSKEVHSHSGEVDLEKVDSLWDKIEADSAVLHPIKRNQPARFIARVKEDPIKQLTEEQA